MAQDQPGRWPQIDTKTASIARIYDYWLGGKDNFKADREAAELMIQQYPDIVTGVRKNRAFLGRAVHYLAAEAGIRQFLDIGTGLPSSNNTHEVAQRAAPESRIVYVDNDPMVLAHARALLKSAPGGEVGYVDADVRDAASIIAGARETLDFRQPVAVLLLFTLAYVGGAEAAMVVSSLMAAVPPGSYLALYHLASDMDPELGEAAVQWNTMMPAQPISPRSRGEVAGLAAGLDFVLPGLTPATAWRPAHGDPQFDRAVPLYGLVARKP